MNIENPEAKKRIGPSKWRERISRLDRRASWIEDRAVDLHDNSFDAAEASAIRWAIPILEQYIEAYVATLPHAKAVGDKEEPMS